MDSKQRLETDEHCSTEQNKQTKNKQNRAGLIPVNPYSLPV